MNFSAMASSNHKTIMKIGPLSESPSEGIGNEVAMLDGESRSTSEDYKQWQDWAIQIRETMPHDIKLLASDER